MIKIKSPQLNENSYHEDLYLRQGQNFYIKGIDIKISGEEN